MRRSTSSNTTAISDPLIAAVVVVLDGRVLLIRRAVAGGELLWQFPAGKAELGEPAEEAAVREAREETGLTVEAGRVLGGRIHPATGRRMLYVACRVLSGAACVASARKVAEVAWADRGQLVELIPGGVFGPVRAYLDGALR
ncbi:NUDIX hydrolase [Streptomyces sp. NPDC020096]